MVLGIKEGLVECATVCIKSVVILKGITELMDGEIFIPHKQYPLNFDDPLNNFLLAVCSINS